MIPLIGGQTRVEWLFLDLAALYLKNGERFRLILNRKSYYVGFRLGIQSLFCVIPIPG